MDFKGLILFCSLSKVRNLAVKYKYKEFESLLKGINPAVVPKAFLLANGMISAYGYNKETALKEAISIAQNWYENGNKYFDR